jgi:cbb3-type cytochrome oxidase subunit 3
MAAELSLLDYLEDIVEPEIILTWQPAIGHWLLLAITLLLLGFLLWRLYKNHQAGQAQRAALAALDQLNWQDPAAAAAINQLLKRLLKSYHPNHPMLVADTQNWQQFLQRLLPEQQVLPDLQILLYHSANQVDPKLREQWWHAAHTLVQRLNTKTAVPSASSKQVIETSHA